MPKQHFVARGVILNHTAYYGLWIYDKCETEYWLENNMVRNYDIESRKNLACFQTYETDV